MKKPFVLIAAIVAVVGLGTAVAVGKETIKVKTSVQLKYHPNDGNDPSGGGSFSGQVKARKGCQKGREVVLKSINVVDARVGSDKSNNRGKYKIKWRGGRHSQRFYVQAKEKKITKSDGDKVVCKRGTSNKFGFGSQGRRSREARREPGHQGGPK